MKEDTKLEQAQYETIQAESVVESDENNTIVPVSISLNEESKALIEQLITETDEQKARDLTQLFNANQNKKTMVRVNKLSDLLDTITEQALNRFTAKPDEISNKELFDGLKIVQDLIERGQKQVSGAGEIPLIQVNQQTNEVNIGGAPSTLSRDSREKVKSAVLSLLSDLSAKQVYQEDLIDVVELKNVEGDDDTDGK